MRLTEFYSMSEERDSYYTVETDGRLVEWDQTMLGDDEGLFEETSYEVIAQGDAGTLIEELGRRLKLSEHDIDRIEFGLSMGCRVTVVNEGNEVKVRL